MINKSRIFEVYEGTKGKKRVLYTKNLVPGRAVYGENLIKDGNVEYREWEPTRSKLSAMIMKGCSNVFIRSGNSVLYLGASTGTTVSHVSDMVGKEGFIFAIDVAHQVLRELVYLAEERPNIAPILADCTTMNYPIDIPQVDVVYQDIAQREQVKIFANNCKKFLKKGGYCMLVIKARSIDVTKNPGVIYKEVLRQLEKDFTIIDYKKLDPFEKDHAMFIMKRK